MGVAILFYALFFVLGITLVFGGEDCLRKCNFEKECTKVSYEQDSPCSYRCICDDEITYHTESTLTPCGIGKRCDQGACVREIPRKCQNRYGWNYIGILNPYNPCMYRCHNVYSDCSETEEDFPDGSRCYTYSNVFGRCLKGRCITGYRSSLATEYEEDVAVETEKVDAAQTSSFTEAEGHEQDFAGTQRSSASGAIDRPGVEVNVNSYSVANSRAAGYAQGISESQAKNSAETNGLIGSQTVVSVGAQVNSTTQTAGDTILTTKQSAVAAGNSIAKANAGANVKNYLNASTIEKEYTQEVTRAKEIVPSQAEEAAQGSAGSTSVGYAAAQANANNYSFAIPRTTGYAQGVNNSQEYERSQVDDVTVVQGISENQGIGSFGIQANANSYSATNTGATGFSQSVAQTQGFAGTQAAIIGAQIGTYGGIGSNGTQENTNNPSAINNSAAGFSKRIAEVQMFSGSQIEAATGVQRDAMYQKADSVGTQINTNSYSPINSTTNMYGQGVDGTHGVSGSDAVGISEARRVIGLQGVDATGAQANTNNYSTINIRSTGNAQGIIKAQRAAISQHAGYIDEQANGRNFSATNDTTLKYTQGVFGAKGVAGSQGEVGYQVSNSSGVQVYINGYSASNPKATGVVVSQDVTGYQTVDTVRAEENSNNFSNVGVNGYAQGLPNSQQVAVSQIVDSVVEQANASGFPVWNVGVAENIGAQKIIGPKAEGITDAQANVNSFSLARIDGYPQRIGRSQEVVVAQPNPNIYLNSDTKTSGYAQGVSGIQNFFGFPWVESIRANTDNFSVTSFAQEASGSQGITGFQTANSFGRQANANIYSTANADYAQRAIATQGIDGFQTTGASRI